LKLQTAVIRWGLFFSMPEVVVKGELRPLRNPVDDPD
jgi:hypothetical protein